MMNLTSPSDIRALSARHGIALTRLRGQHFLIDRRSLAAVADAADLKKNDSVLEVGPGFGTLTVELARRAGSVIAVELDKRFLPVLEETVGGFPNVRIIHGDILKLPTTHYPLPTHYKIVSNLPYGISSEFLWKTMTEWDPAPERLVLMLQREVAERLAAKPPRMNLLALMAQTFGSVELLRRVPAGAFFPPPRVESSVVRIIRGPEVNNRDRILAIARMGFSSPRKKLAGTLEAFLKRKTGDIRGLIASSGASPDARPSELELDEWRALAGHF